MGILDRTTTIFDRIAFNAEHKGVTHLGSPSPDAMFAGRRMNAMAEMNPRGFRQHKAGPKLSRGGLSRREREAMNGRKLINHRP